MSIYNPTPLQTKQETSSWIWRTGAFAGEFGDAFIRNTNLEVGVGGVVVVGGGGSGGGVGVGVVVVVVVIMIIIVSL